MMFQICSLLFPFFFLPSAALYTVVLCTNKKPTASDASTTVSKRKRALTEPSSVSKHRAVPEDVSMPSKKKKKAAEASAASKKKKTTEASAASKKKKVTEASAASKKKPAPNKRHTAVQAASVKASKAHEQELAETYTCLESTTKDAQSWLSSGVSKGTIPTAEGGASTVVTETAPSAAKSQPTTSPISEEKKKPMLDLHNCRTEEMFPDAQFTPCRKEDEGNKTITGIYHV
ncbi:hypothetical protein QR680_006904 [Steinernema hermaphroditum]|uniref:Uncharacterized protein n=1 Tax=Steinernema hermaphroditum TaxID=289476 RepID=A0AA39LY58_9BILA|nr:hypothetical protein QR680_006904 [Steinernema hermaphroditum]